MKYIIFISFSMMIILGCSVVERKSTQESIAYNDSCIIGRGFDMFSLKHYAGKSKQKYLICYKLNNPSSITILDGARTKTYKVENFKGFKLFTSIKKSAAEWEGMIYDSIFFNNKLLFRQKKTISKGRVLNNDYVKIDFETKRFEINSMNDDFCITDCLQMTDIGRGKYLQMNLFEGKLKIKIINNIFFLGNDPLFYNLNFLSLFME